MIIDNNRNKLINAIIYFASNTKYCGQTKLFKLLYFLDFEHYRQTGRSITGLEYFAWRMGPVPVALYDELNCPEPDLAEKISIEYVQTKFEKPMLLPRPKAEFESFYFTKRELHILEQLSREYNDSNAEDMIEATHLENLPWNQVYNNKGLKQGLIPYEYAILKAETELMQNIISENNEIKSNYT